MTNTGITTKTSAPLLPKRSRRKPLLPTYVSELLERDTMTGVALRNARTVLGISQAELAVILRVSQGAISSWELTTPPFAVAVLVDEMLRRHVEHLRQEAVSV